MAEGGDDTPKFSVDFSEGGANARAGGKLDSMAYHRNRKPVEEVLRPYFSGRTGHVLEIASGTGQHICDWAKHFPDLKFWPTDPAPVHLASIEAWRAEAGASNLGAPFALDAAADWALGQEGGPPAVGFLAVVALNLAHISPWQVSLGLLKGSAKHLQKGGHLFLYGAFMRDGQHVSERNEKFDQALRSENPAWGVRDIADLEDEGDALDLILIDAVDMPANNYFLIFEKIR